MKTEYDPDAVAFDHASESRLIPVLPHTFGGGVEPVAEPRKKQRPKRDHVAATKRVHKWRAGNKVARKTRSAGRK